MGIKRKSVTGRKAQLNVVKTAGFKLNKREKNTNRRAGLHDKAKNLEEGEVRVNRKKPLALARVRRMRTVAAALACCLFVGVVAAFGAGSFLREDVIKYSGYKTVCYELPSDGSSPTEHSLVENVGYLNYVLQNQKHWSSEMNSTVNAMGFNQSVETYKKFYNGVLISADVAKGFSSKATQFCVNTNSGIVLWRPSANKNFNKMETEWSTGKAEGCTVEEFITMRGFPPSEFSVYVLNEKTIQNAEDYTVVKNGDGNYEMTLELNVGLGADKAEYCADYYYTKQMMVTGDLSNEPSITKTSVTYVFDENWRVLSFAISDEYTAMGVVPCTSNTFVKYDYDESNAVNSYYQDYFKEQENNYVPPANSGEVKPSATEYLGAAFGSVLSEGGIFKVDLSVDGLSLSGAAFVGFDDGNLSDIRVKVGDISVFAGSDGAYYISDGAVKYKLDLSGLSLDGATVAESDGGALDFDALTEQLMGGKFTVGDGFATLESELELFGLKVSLTFDFRLVDKAIKLGYVKAEVPLGNTVIKARMEFGTESDVPELPESYEGYIDVMNDGLTVDLSVGFDKLLLNGFAHVEMSGGEFAGLYAELDGIGAYYSATENALFLSDGVIKYKLPVSAFAGGKGVFASGTAVNGLLNQILENLAAVDGKISTAATLDILGQTVTAALGVKISGGIAIDAQLNAFGKDFKLGVALSDRVVELPDLSGYSDILNDGVTVNAELLLDGLKLDGKIYIGLKDGKFTELRADFGGVKVYYDNAAGEVYMNIGTTKIYVSFEDTKGIIDLLDLIQKGESGNIDLDTAKLLADLLGNLTAGLREIYSGAEISLPVGNLLANATLSLPDKGEGLKISVDTALFGVGVTLNAQFSNENVPALSDGEKAEHIDAFKNTWELVNEIVGEHIAAKVEGELYDKSNAYAQSANVKYTFGALLEYDRSNGYYAHLNIGLTASIATDDSFYIDLVLADANPVETDNAGRTKGGYYADGNYDVYLSVSKYPESNPAYSPLKLYAPADEILTLVSMVGAAANLDGLTFENSEFLTQAVQKIANVIDEQLISKYIPYTKDQFASLGDSLIPQIIGTDLKGLLDKLLGNANVPAVGGSDGFNVTDEYIDRIEFSDETLKIILNSPLVYGTEDIDADKYLTVEFTREKDENGVYRVAGIVLDHIYFGKDNVNRLDMNMTLGYGEIPKPDVNTGYGGYLNLYGLDTMLKATVNSATHETPEGDTQYGLNHTYFLNGKVSANLSILPSANIDINVNTLKIVIDENNNVSADVHISYKALKVLGMVTAIDGGCDVYLSVKNDMVYVKRIKTTNASGKAITPETVVRIMPVSAFLEDIMEQINFMFNFGSVIADQLRGIDVSGGNGAGFDGKDYGGSMDYVLSKYIYAESGNSVSWTAGISGKILSDLVGMGMSEIPITINADKNADGTLTLTGLDIAESKMTLFGSISLKFSGNLKYCNPHEQMLTDENGNPLYTDSTVNLGSVPVDEFDGNSWNDVLGGESFAQISAHTSWDKMLGETNRKFLEYTGEPLTVKYIAFEYATDENNSSFTPFGFEQPVLYNAKTNSVYTKFVAPNLSVMPAVEGKTAVWRNACRIEGDKLVCQAVYDFVYNVTIDSPFKTDGNYEFVDGVWRRTIEGAYEHVYLRKDLTYTDDDGVRYGLKGYSLQPDGSIIDFGTIRYNESGELCYSVEVSSDAKYYAVWEKIYAVNFRNDGGVETVYYYAGESLADRLPQPPEKEGYTGSWNCDADAVVTADMDGTTIDAVYAINEYTVKVVSSQQFNGTLDGFAAESDGVYSLTANYGTQVNLPQITAVSNAYVFGGYYDNADFNGEPVTSFDIKQDATYYVKWVGKTVTVRYYSDLFFSKLAYEDKDESGNVVGYYYDETLTYGKEEILSGFTVEGKTLLGWFMHGENDSYSFVSSADALKNTLIDSLDDNGAAVTLYAVWVDPITVSVTSSSYSWFNLRAVGSYSGGGYASALSAQIADKIGMTYSARVELCSSSDGVNIGETWGKSFNGDGVSFDIKNTASKNTAYAGARVTLSYSIGSAVVRDDLSGIAFRKT